ncbi:PEP-CTERM sorting domain-containing protein [Mariniblastus sp.]|nr:PEP-CTERM sorting domain-containing protein [Mariniblastus sp.]
MKPISLFFLIILLLPRISFAQIIGLGFLEGGGQDSIAKGISKDGSTVVGKSDSSNGLLEAFSWTLESGMVGLGDLPGGDPGNEFKSMATGVSGDGSIVAGLGDSTNSSTPSSYAEAFCWTKEKGMVGLGDLGGDTFGSFVEGISADGSTLVGAASRPSSSYEYDAFRWTADSGMIGLGNLPGRQGQSRATATSDTGDTIVGHSQNTDDGSWEAFIWKQDSAMIGLGFLEAGGFSSEANAVSGDGKVVVGRSNIANRSIAFKWTEETGMLGLMDSESGLFTNSIAQGVSDNGMTIIGDGYDSNGRLAFLWQEEVGMVSLFDSLTTLGHDMSHWESLTSASGISSDGTTISGWGINHQGNQEAFVASITSVPEPNTPLLFGVGLAWIAAKRRRRAAQK